MISSVPIQYKYCHFCNSLCHTRFSTIMHQFVKLILNANCTNYIYILCISNRKPRDDAVSTLHALGAEFEVRHLKVGDFAWIIRNLQTGCELMLPYIVERKRIDDFSKSIMDGRFHEQKVFSFSDTFLIYLQIAGNFLPNISTIPGIEFCKKYEGAFNISELLDLNVMHISHFF